MSTARREAAICKALVRRSSHPASSASNTADGSFSPCPAGATAVHHCQRRLRAPTFGAVLAKGITLTCERRLALMYCCGSEFINISMVGYLELLAFAAIHSAVECSAIHSKHIRCFANIAVMLLQGKIDHLFFHRLEHLIELKFVCMYCAL